jgi:alkylation response protein AidB-like acyl-CoA dehydrogenase
MLDQSIRVSGATPAELAARAHALVPELSAGARDAEQQRQVPVATMAKVKRAELHRLCQPKLFGGFEYGGETLIDIALPLASACAATAWCTIVAAGHHWLLAKFDRQAQEDVWGADAHAMLCGSYAPTGQATSEAGGYRLTGKWSFASGCDHASWAIVGGIIPGDKPRPAFFLIPAADYAIEDDWFTSGLSGTGSKTVASSGCFVPTHRIIDFTAAMGGAAPGVALHESPLYRLPLVSYVATLLGSVAVGAAQSAVRDYQDRIKVRETRGAIAGGRMRMADFATIQVRVGEAAACAATAETLLRNIMRSLDKAAGAGRAMSTEERITLRRDQAFAVKLAIQATDALNASTGGAGLYLADPVQRAWRDANAVGRHVSLNWDAVGTMYGQMVLGLPPIGQY